MFLRETVESILRDPLLPEPAPPEIERYLGAAKVPEWQRLVRTFVDRQRVVCATGSNASLLGRERATP